MFKKLAKWILRNEISEYDACVDRLTKEKEGLTSELVKVCNERNKYKERLAASIKYILPNGVVSKIIAVLPNPNDIGNKPELRVDKEFVITGDATRIADPEMRWFFDVKFERLVKISDVKIVIEVSLRNNHGYSKLEIPAVIDHLGGQGEITSWVWNFWEAGLVMIPDDIYGVIFRATDAWNNVKHELGL